MNYCDEALTNSKLLVAYGEVIRPVPDVDANSDRGGYPNIGPPTLKRQPGRPRIARRKSNVEGPLRPQQTRRSNTVRCSTCKQFGLNNRTCQRAPTR